MEIAAKMLILAKFITCFVFPRSNLDQDAKAIVEVSGKNTENNEAITEMK